jgi:hypothetical protein
MAAGSRRDSNTTITRRRSHKAGSTQATPIANAVAVAVAVTTKVNRTTVLRAAPAFRGSTTQAGIS